MANPLRLPDPFMATVIYAEHHPRRLWRLPFGRSDPGADGSREPPSPCERRGNTPPPYGRAALAGEGDGQVPGGGPKPPGGPRRRSRRWKIREAEAAGQVPAGEYHWLEVYELDGDQAPPLPPDWFTGPRDKRYGFQSGGGYAEIPP